MDIKIDVNALANLAVGYSIKVALALFIFVVGRWIVKAVVATFRGVLEKRKVDPTVASFIGNIASAALLAFVIIAALGQLGIQTASFVAILGAAGLAIGLALQGSLSNFAAGVIIIVFRPFKAGDFVEAGGQMGIIEEITVFSTLMRTGDNKQVTVPNAAITGGAITNYSAKPTRRVDMEFGIAYDADIDAAKKILLDLVNADSRILEEPAPVIAVSALADSSVNLVCRPHVATADYWAVFFDMQENVKKAFDQAGIGIPFPQMDVHVRQTG